MLIVVTGLDGSGTSSIAKELSKLDHNSVVVNTPSPEYKDRNYIDDVVRKESSVAHMLYYLSSTVFASDYIRNNLDYTNNNVYVVRYLIDTVVSNRVAGIPLELNYNLYGNQLLEPDLTLFIDLEEHQRQNRINTRGKSILDEVLDKDDTREKFLSEFQRLLIPEKTIYVDNSKPLEYVVNKTYKELKVYNEKFLAENRKIELKGDIFTKNDIDSISYKALIKNRQKDLKSSKILIKKYDNYAGGKGNKV